jgi:predicted transglutaminase-like cysteine proteinase
MVSARVSFQTFGARALTLISLILLAGWALPAHAQMFRMDSVPKAAAAEPFGRTTGFAPAGLLWIKWQDMEKGLSRAEQALATCHGETAACAPALQPLAAIVADAARRDGRERLASVNRAINLAIAYADDSRGSGDPEADVWSGPAATFASRRGDCEDYAIAKLFALRAAGVPKEDLRLMVVRLSASGNNHAVLAVRSGGAWLLLDNRTMTLASDTQAQTHGVTPLFALDSTGVRQYATAAATLVAAHQPSPAEIYPYDPVWLAM